jgi:hypothetical protein
MNMYSDENGSAIRHIEDNLEASQTWGTWGVVLIAPLPTGTQPFYVNTLWPPD